MIISCTPAPTTPEAPGYRHDRSCTTDSSAESIRYAWFSHQIAEAFRNLTRPLPPPTRYPPDGFRRAEITARLSPRTRIQTSSAQQHSTRKDSRPSLQGLHHHRPKAASSPGYSGDCPRHAWNNTRLTPHDGNLAQAVLHTSISVRALPGIPKPRSASLANRNPATKGPRTYEPLCGMPPLVRAPAHTPPH